MKENKNENVCERNFDGRFSEELTWRVVQQITSDEDHGCFGDILHKHGSKFSRTKSFCFENWIFYSHST